jgi:hypothetical protein
MGGRKKGANGSVGLDFARTLSVSSVDLRHTVDQLTGIEARRGNLLSAAAVDLAGKALEGPKTPVGPKGVAEATPDASAPVAPAAVASAAVPSEPRTAWLTAAEVPLGSPPLGRRSGWQCQLCSRDYPTLWRVVIATPAGCRAATRALLSAFCQEPLSRLAAWSFGPPRRPSRRNRLEEGPFRPSLSRRKAHLGALA